MTANRNRRRPITRPVFHHTTFATLKLDEMVAFYEKVAGLEPVFHGEEGAWLTNDEANHRIALLALPGLKAPEDKGHTAGLHHTAFEYADFDQWLDNYERLAAEGIRPFLNLDPGMTMSMYYQDPEGNGVEIQVDAFGDTHALDLETASGGRFGPDVLDAIGRWGEVREWLADVDLSTGRSYELAEIGPLVPRPPQVFAIGLNYVDHANESGFQVPTDPVVFTKFASSLTGPDTDVAITGPKVDWEAELVVVISGGGRDIAAADAWDHIAGLAVGQDLSDRDIQFWGNPPQFSLGKSPAGFAPVGPWIVDARTVAETHDLGDLEITATLTTADGSERVLQHGFTRDMVFSIPTLIARLSAVVELYPGDLIFTGTPDGVGLGRTPQEFLSAGETLTTTISGVGTIRQRFVEG